MVYANNMHNDSIMPNNKITLMMNEIYNKWWVSVREFNQDTNSKEVDGAIKIITDYVATNFDDYPIARKLVLAYIDELMARTNGGYIS
jgi:hypothetical protein